MPTAYVAWRAYTSNGVVVLARQDGNRFLGFLKGLLIRAQRWNLEQSMGARNPDLSYRPPAYVVWRAGTTILFQLGC